MCIALLSVGADKLVDNLSCADLELLEGRLPLFDLQSTSNEIRIENPQGPLAASLARFSEGRFHSVNVYSCGFP
jgi:hypothetical protein